MTLTFDAYDLASYDYSDANGNQFTGYETVSGDYAIRLMRNSHTDGVMAENGESAFVLHSSGITFAKDPDTDADVGNLFTGDTAYADTPIDGSTMIPGGVDYLSRADGFANYPTAAAASPGSNVNQVGVYEYDGYDSADVSDIQYGVDAGMYLVVVENENGSTQCATLAQLEGTDTSGGTLVINEELMETLSDYDAPEWDAFLDQLSEQEVKELIGRGGFKNVAVYSVGKPLCTDRDGPAGFNMGVTNPNTETMWTGFPTESLIGCCWNPSLTYSMGVAQGKVASATGLQGWYAPGVNLHRSVYNTRNYEYFSEDAVLTGQLAAAIVKGAKETFPMVNGYPLLAMGCGEFNEQGCASFSEHLRDLLALPQEQDGQAVDWQTQAEYITWLKTFRQLIAEGTIDSNIFLDKRQQVSEKLLRGQYFCLIYQWSDMEAEQRQLYYEIPKGAYMAVDGPKNSAGDDHTLSGVGMNGWTVTFITRDCRDPEKAIQLMAFLMSEEGQKLTALGVEGVDYTWEDGVPVPSQEAQNLLRQDYPAYIASIGANNTYWMLLDNTLQSQWQTACDPALEQIRTWAMGYTVDNTPYEVAFPPGSEAELINRRTERLWGETLPQLLLAASEEEFDRLLSQYVEQRAQLGWDQLQQAKTRQYEINRERLAVIAAQQGGEA